MNKDKHRNQRAKRLVSSAKRGSAAVMKKAIKGEDRVSGAAPTAFPVKGQKSSSRMDKKKRYASGGGVDDSPKAKKGAKTEVNIVIAGGQGDKQPQPIPVPVPAGGPPPGAGMPPGGPPPGMPPRPMPPGARPPMGGPPGMGAPAMRRGGSVKEEYPIDAGSGGGEGRLEKSAAAKRAKGIFKGDD